MKFSFPKIILISLFVIQIISLKYEPKTGSLLDFLKVPGSSSYEQRYEPRFKSMADPPTEENKANNIKPNNKKTNAKNNGKAAPAAIKVIDLNSPEAVLNEWMTILSTAFLDETKYPTIKMEEGIEIKIKTRNNQRINENWAAAQADGAPTDEAFWFVMKGHYIYYFSSKKDINVLDSILVKTVQNNRNHFSQYSGNDDSCIDVTDISDHTYIICFKARETKLSWLCSMEKLFEMKQEIDCIPLEDINRPDLDFSKYKLDIKEVKDVQPVVIIPRGGRKCNEGWNYKLKGNDWECGCKEGKKQSPINLPTKDFAELSPIHPMFEYDKVKSVINFESYDGFLQNDDKVKISFFKGAVRILHPRLGKIVTEDGGVYVAEEITFHTPSEHKINGEQFDLEMQIIHYGRSVGDIAKQVVLSFLFKKTPGIYNKFMDSINFTNLPNPLDPTKFIEEDFSLFDVFYTPDEELDVEFKGFSFYSYEGSLTFPPCTERTTYLVAADPIPLSSTVITLFQEALLKPDLIGEDMILSDANGELENHRDVQPLNGRIVSIYNHWKFGCGVMKKKPPKKEENGHFEKRLIDVPHYIYVNGNEPSNIPGAKLVSEEEAKAISPKEPKENEYEEFFHYSNTIPKSPLYY